MFEEIAFWEEASFWIVFALLALFVYKVLTKKTLKSSLIFMIPAGVLALAASEIMKLAIRSPRPCESLVWCPQSFSFPSSHAFVAFAVFTAIYLETGRDRRYILLFVIPALVAISRVVVGVHRIEDVVAGSLLGVAVAWGYVRAYERLKKKVKDK